MVIFKSALGNLVPLGLVSISDMHKKSYRPYFIGTTSIYAAAFIAIRYSISTLSALSFSAFLIPLILVTILLVHFQFFDEEDRKSDLMPYGMLKDAKYNSWIQKLFGFFRRVPLVFSLIFQQTFKDSKKIVSDIRSKVIRAALMGYFWWEVSMYSIVVSAVDLSFFPKNSLFPLIMMCGFLFGAIIVFTLLRRWTDQRVIKWGYWISVVSLVPVFIFGWGEAHRELTLEVCYFFHAAGNAFLSAAFMSLLAREREHHVQGRTYGLIDSFDNLAFLVGTVLGICFQMLELNVIYLVIFSFASFLLSIKYYKRFQGKYEQKS